MSNMPKGRSGGVLPVNAATRKNANQQTGPKTSTRAPALKLRLIIRRLPPGLTETEFWAALGETWKAGAGKVEWTAFKDGKISKDPAKPSRPSRAYLKVKEQSLLEELSNLVKQTSFLDAKNTSRDSCLLGPPSLEFAPYNKIPAGRPRHDGRQGTIDQDQEFIDFLQGLTEPITKPTTNGADSNEGKADKVSTTPLVQYIKEKKANKAKEASQAKAAKTREGKEGKASKSESKSTVIIKGKNATTTDKERVAKATQDAVKAINKSVAALQGGKQTSSKAETKQDAKEKTSASEPPATPKRERERGNASAAARMLQRDLGLVAKESKAQRVAKVAAAAASSANATDATAATKTAAPASKSATESVKKDKGPSKSAPPPTPAPANPPSGPRASRTASSATASVPAKSSTASTQRPAKSSPQPSASAKSAFLKHANPSQGITEEALQTVFKQFGTITRCEIDKKKGLGYVDFNEADALKKAMQASPVKVANGQVTVLENKNSQGGGKRGGGQQKESAKQSGATASTAKPATAETSGAESPSTSATAKQSEANTIAPGSSSAASTTATTSADPATPTTPTAASSAPPSAPRGSSRSGGRGGRGSASGGRGSNKGSGQSSRGRGGGGRGNGRRGGAGGTAATTSSSAGADGGGTPAGPGTPAAGGEAKTN